MTDKIQKAYRSSKNIYLIWRQWFYHESGYSERACARDVEVSEEEKEEALKAVRQCPVGAISLVEAE